MSDPVLTIDSAVKTLQALGDAVDVVLAHVGNLLEVENAYLVERFLDRGTDALYLFEIVTLSMGLRLCFRLRIGLRLRFRIGLRLRFRTSSSTSKPFLIASSVIHLSAIFDSPLSSSG